MENAHRLLALLVLLGIAGCGTPIWKPVDDQEQPAPLADEAGDIREDLPVAVEEIPAIPKFATKEVFGWVEWICLEPEGIRLKSKLDSGAHTSSINAMNLRRFERDGQRWVSFDIFDRSGERRIRLERPISRNVRIVRHDEARDRRPVVELQVRMGGIYQKSEFTLIDRSNFVYQVLIGRNFLRGYALIDSERTFLSGRPSCGGAPEAVGEVDILSDEDALDDGN